MCTLGCRSDLSCAHLDRVAGLGGDALHGQDDLEGVLPNVPGTHTAIITIMDKCNSRFAIDFQSELTILAFLEVPEYWDPSQSSGTGP